jgi:hypothetical protein
MGRSNCTSRRRFLYAFSRFPVALQRNRAGPLLALLASIAALLASPTVFADFVPGRVGDRGGSERIVIEGCRAVSEQEVRAELMADLEVALAASPAGEMDTYVSTLRARLLAGYLASGFHRARVDAEWDAARRRVVLRVIEGPRFLCGGVRVTGTKALPVDQLVRRLTTEHKPAHFPGTVDPTSGAIQAPMFADPDDKPHTIWDREEAAPLDVWALADLNKKVRDAVAELGFLRPAFTINVVPDEEPAAPVAPAGVKVGANVPATAPASRRATLVVAFTNEGPAATLDSIQVIGLKRNTADDVIRYAGINKGGPITTAMVESVQQRLWDSARFMKHLVSAEPLPEDASKMRLRLDLEEYPQAPALAEPFSPAEQAALRCREWLLDPAKEEDVWLSIANKGVKGEPRIVIVCGYGRGLVARYQTNPDLAAAAGRPGTPATRPVTQPGARPASPVDMAICLTRGLSGFWDLVDRQKCVGGGMHETLDASLHFVADPDAGSGRHWSFGVSANMNDRHRRAQDAPLPVNFKLTLAPVAFVYLVHEGGFTSDVKDGVLTGTSAGGTRVRVETATGRVLECRYVDADGAVTELRARRGTLADEIAALEAGAPAGTNRFDRQAPLASILHFTADELARWMIIHIDGNDVQRRAAGAAMGKVFAPALFRPLDDLLAAQEPPGSLGFSIPADPQKVERAKAAGPMRDFAMFALGHSGSLYPYGSWPWVIIRQTALAIAGEDRAIRPEWERLLKSDEMGPIGCLLAAEALRGSDPQLAATFAGRGLARLDAEHAAGDWKALLTADGPLPRLLLGAAENLRGLSRDEVDALGAGFDGMVPSFGEALRAVAADLRAGRAKPLAEALPDTLDRLWVTSIQDGVGKALRAIVAEAGAAK